MIHEKGYCVFHVSTYAIKSRRCEKLLLVSQLHLHLFVRIKSKDGHYKDE